VVRVRAAVSTSVYSQDIVASGVTNDVAFGDETGSGLVDTVTINIRTCIVVAQYCSHLRVHYSRNNIPVI